jgi:hypothetical protein
MIKSAVLKISIVVASLAVTTACSKQWREVDTGATEEEILEVIDRMQASPQAASVGTNLLTALRDDPSNVVYFKKSASPGAFPETVLSLIDMSPFIGGSSPVNVFQLGLSEVSVVLIDGVASTSFGDERHFLLMIEMVMQDGSREYFARSSGPGAYFFDNEGDTFEAEFTDANGETIILKTYDLDEEYADELAATVKFDVFRLNGDGSSSLLGQIAALAGFGD